MEFVETSGFSSLREDYLGNRQLHLLQLHLATSPDAGSVIRGSGGVRKLRWGEHRKRKRGGLGVAYFRIPEKHQILLLTIYRESEATDVSHAAVLRMKRIVKSIS